MSLYVLGDPHLSLGVDKPMDIFGGWGNYVERIKKNWRDIIKKDDTILTSGGIYARVIAVKEQDVEAEISHNVRVKIAKSAIVSVLDNNKPVTPEVIKK